MTTGYITGRFELPSPATANVFVQAYWGALFCIPFGFSFTALRFSTLTLGGVGILACYLLLREIGSDWWTALLGALALAVNPLYFALANTFMTDVPFLAFVVAALLLFVRGVRRQETISLLAGILIALLAVLIRQFGLLLLLAFGVSYVMHKGATRNAFVVAIVPMVVGISLHVFFQRWLVETGRTPFLGQTLYNLSPTPLGLFVRYSLGRIITALPYLGFFIAPFLASVVLFGSHPNGRNGRLLIYILLVVLAGAILVALYTRVYTPVPEIGHILTPSGVGPRTLRDTFLLHQNFPVIPAALTIFWVGSIVLGAFGGAEILLCFGRTATQVAKGIRRPEWRAESWPEVLMLVFIGTYASVLILGSFGTRSPPLFDRYLLLFVPAILVLVVSNEFRSESTRPQGWRLLLSAALIFVYAVVAVSAAHDYLAWNRARWMATRTLMDAGI
jgi:4-amino-4-deoxy-L-arabinose transferase-like glycosyltransferase